MRYHELSRNFLTKVQAQQKLLAAKCTFRVDAIGLSEDNLGYPSFPHELVARREWCNANCKDAHWIEPIRDDGMRLIGRSFFLNVLWTPCTSS